LRVVAITVAARSTAMFKAAWPSAEVAPLINRVCPLQSARLPTRQVQAVGDCNRRGRRSVKVKNLDERRCAGGGPHDFPTSTDHAY
jgi:hypothetical protein